MHYIVILYIRGLYCAVSKVSNICAHTHTHTHTHTHIHTHTHTHTLFMPTRDKVTRRNGSLDYESNDAALCCQMLAVPTLMNTSATLLNVYNTQVVVKGAVHQAKGLTYIQQHCRHRQTLIVVLESTEISTDDVLSKFRGLYPSAQSLKTLVNSPTDIVLSGVR